MFIDIFPSYKALGRPRCAGQFQEGFSTLLRPLSVPRWENSEMDGLVGTIRRKKTYSGWWYTYPDLPLWKMMEFVSWDDYSQYMEKMIQTTNQYIFDSFDVQWIGLVGKSETVELPSFFMGKSIISCEDFLKKPIHWRCSSQSVTITAEFEENWWNLKVPGAHQVSIHTIYTK